MDDFPDLQEEMSGDQRLFDVSLMNTYVGPSTIVLVDVP
jgi:hypothetical protein